MSSDVETIKERLSLEEVISAYITLEKAGANLRARCPFHNEKTPSFYVSPDRNLYYCFGCGVKGDAFTFVQEYEGVDFKGALKLLADKAGVELTFSAGDKKDEYDRLYNILEEATSFFEEALEKNEEAKKYLKKRGVSTETQKEFRIGLAPDGWHNLKEHLVSKGYSESEIDRAGLIKKKEDGKGKGYYDRFRARIIFPISDTAGRVIAFSGRVLEGDDRGAKYLNSPETPLFNKSNVLYGYDKAKKQIRKFDFSILVEGQFDLVLSHQAGYRNTVAISGTSLTLHHLNLIKRLSTNVVFAPDDDDAGFNSLLRSASIALSAGFDAKVARMSKDKDPADVIAEGKDAWKGAIKDATPVIEYATERYKKESGDERKFWKQVSVHVVPLIARIPDAIDRSHFIKQTALKSGIPEKSLLEQVGKSKADTPSMSGSEETIDIKKGVVSEVEEGRADRLIKRIVGLVEWQRSKDVPDIELEEVQARFEGLVPGEERATFDDDLVQKLIFEAERDFSGYGTISKIVNEFLLILEEELTNKKLYQASESLKQAESDRDDAEVKRLLGECQKLSSHLHSLKEKIQHSV